MLKELRHLRSGAKWSSNRRPWSVQNSVGYPLRSSPIHRFLLYMHGGQCNDGQSLNSDGQLLCSAVGYLFCHLLWWNSYFFGYYYVQISYLVRWQLSSPCSVFVALTMPYLGWSPDVRQVFTERWWNTIWAQCYSLCSSAKVSAWHLSIAGMLHYDDEFPREQFRVSTSNQWGQSTIPVTITVWKNTCNTHPRIHFLFKQGQEVIVIVDPLTTITQIASF